MLYFYIIGSKPKTNAIWSSVLCDRSLTDVFSSAAKVVRVSETIARGSETYDISATEYQKRALQYQTDERVTKEKLDSEMDEYTDADAAMEKDAGSLLDNRDDKDDETYNPDEVEGFGAPIASSAGSATSLAEAITVPNRKRANASNGRPGSRNGRSFGARRKTFKPNADPAKVGRIVANELNEHKVFMFVELVRVIGNVKAQEYLSKTLEIEAMGGMMTVKGDRRKSAGGVFITMLKDAPELDQAEIKRVLSVTNRKVLSASKLAKKSMNFEKRLQLAMDEHKKAQEDKDNLNDNVGPSSGVSAPVPTPAPQNSVDFLAPLTPCNSEDRNNSRSGIDDDIEDGELIDTIVESGDTSFVEQPSVNIAGDDIEIDIDSELTADEFWGT